MTDQTATSSTWRRPLRTRPALAYFLIGVGLWFLVDWGTAGGFDPAYLAAYMPALLIFYLGYPAIFTWLVFGLRWGWRRLFAATAVAILAVEVVFVHNPWLIVPPLLFIGIPLALAIYAPLTFFPLWIVRGEMGRHHRLVQLLVAVELAVAAATIFGRG